MSYRSLYCQKRDFDKLVKKIKRNLSARFTRACGTFRNENYLTHLGCSVEELISHFSLPSKNLEYRHYGYSSNRGGWSKKEWEIDHIRPLSSFRLQYKYNREKCFHYSNLQALPVRENRKKSSTYKGKHY